MQVYEVINKLLPCDHAVPCCSLSNLHSTDEKMLKSLVKSWTLWGGRGGSPSTVRVGDADCFGFFFFK